MEFSMKMMNFRQEVHDKVDDDEFEPLRDEAATGNVTKRNSNTTASSLRTRTRQCFLVCLILLAYGCGRISSPTKTVASIPAGTTTTTTKTPSSWCTTLLANQTPDGVHPSVQSVLREHCLINPRLPLERMLPDMDMFVSIHDTISSYQRRYNTTISLVAGRGTTGTHGIYAMIEEEDRLGTLHYLGPASCPKYPLKAECMRKQAKQLYNYTKSDQFQIGIRENQDVGATEYTQLHQHVATTLANVLLQCGPCGPSLVISDTPWVNIFTELYLAAGPDTKVVLTRRDASEWSASRIKNHGKSHMSFVCRPPSPPPSSTLPLPAPPLDPFSYTQCQGPASDLGAVPASYLAACLKQYTSYVHSMIPGNRLLDLNLFSYKVLHVEEDGNGNGNAAQELWSKEIKSPLLTFLEP